MKKLFKISIVAFGLMTAGLGHIVAQEFKTGNLIVDHPWSPATPAGAKVAAGYLVVTNKGTEPDRLIGGSTPAAGRIEVHEMAMKDGVMTMRPLSGGLLIEAGKSVTLAPGSFHLMFMDLKAPLKRGDKVSATLEFQKAGKVDVTFDVRPLGSQSPAPSNGGHKM